MCLGRTIISNFTHVFVGLCTPLLCKSVSVVFCYHQYCTVEHLLACKLTVFTKDIKNKKQSHVNYKQNLIITFPAEEQHCIFIRIKVVYIKAYAAVNSEKVQDIPSKKAQVHFLFVQ